MSIMLRHCWKDLLVFIVRENFILGGNIIISLLLIAALVGI